MIEKDSGHFILYCDICAETTYLFDEFMDAVDFKKDNDWQSIKREGEWHDICPSCKEQTTIEF